MIVNKDFIFIFKDNCVMQEIISKLKFILESKHLLQFINASKIHSNDK